ncbi:hypothetical protein V1506DRAFT_503172 [Lipomyces tetrasporus]
MDTQNNNEELLIPPAASVQGIIPPPPPSNPPTKDDVDRALSFKMMVGLSSFGLDNITLADAVREFRQSFRELNAKLDHRLDRVDQRLDRMDQRMSSVEQQTIRQVETNSLLLQNLVAREDLVAQSVTSEVNREASGSNRFGTEVPFVDGNLPSFKGLPVLKSAADIDSVAAEQAREIVTGHGIRV